MATQGKTDEKPMLLQPKRRASLSLDKPVETKVISGFQAHIDRYRNGEVHQVQSFFSGPKSPQIAGNSRLTVDNNKAGSGQLRRRSSVGNSNAAARPNPLPRAKAKAATDLSQLMTDEEREQLKRATFDRADLNLDHVLEATEIKLAYDSCGLEITDDEIWEAIATCHANYEKAHGGEGKLGDSAAQAQRAKQDQLVVDFDRYLAYPEVLPDAFMQATFKMFLPTDTPGTPVSKKSSGNKRRGSGFSYVRNVPDRQPQRHAVLIAIDRYADERIPSSCHCINDTRNLGEVLEKSGYTVEILTNDMEGDAQPTRNAILNSLACSRDRNADMLLVYLAGYWVNAHINESGGGAHKLTQLCLCYDTSLEFTRKNVLTLADIKGAVLGPGSAAPRSTVILVDALQPAFIPGCRGEGFSIVSYMGQDFTSLSHLRHRSLLSYYLPKGLRGAAQAEGGDRVTLASLHRYLGAKLSKYTYTAAPAVPEGADEEALTTQVLDPRRDALHPRERLKSQAAPFVVDCAFPAVTPPEEFPDRFLEAVRALDVLKDVTITEVAPCKCAEFLLACNIQDVQALQSKFKTEIDKLADENTWVRMRATDGGAGADSGPALRWTLAASFGLDLVSPAVLLTIHTGSTESVMKLRMRYLNRHLKEWCGIPILWTRLRVRVICAGSEYERLKLDARWRSGAFSRDKDKEERSSLKGVPSAPFYIYNIEKASPVVWKPQNLPLRSFTRLSEAEFEQLYEGLPLLIHWCGKLTEPNRTLTAGQERTRKAIQDVGTEVVFKNKIHFFQYELDHVVYPRYVVEGLAKYNTRKAEDEVTLVYLKYDRAATMEIKASNARISAERIREFCHDFLQGKAKRLHDGTMKALPPPGLPKEHPGVLVVGINNFDRFAMDAEKDVLVLYWNVQCPTHQRDKLERSATAFAKLGKLFSEQPEDVHLPVLLIMSDDNGESFFFPEHHPDAKVHIPAQRQEETRGDSFASRSPIAGRRLQDGGQRPASSDSLSASQSQSVVNEKPVTTIRLFPAYEDAAWRRRRGEFVDYWPEVFERTVKACKTFFAAANGPGPLCSFMERNTDWAPRVPLRIAIDEETKLMASQQLDKLPDIFKGL